jgi:uncharacterized membrane protein YraQ (UPF0718 family)
MNRAFLIILVPFFVVTVFWLTLGWGWRVAAIGGALEIAIAAGIIMYLSRRRAASPETGSGNSSAVR